MAHEIEIEALPVTMGASRGMWRVWFGGEILIERARDPEFAACRELLARGFEGQLITRHKGSATPCLTMTISAGALAATHEGEAGRVRIGVWTPREMEAEVA